jgi:isopenicillin N synthase-like dioxygenase
MIDIKNLETSGKVYASYPSPLRAAVLDATASWKALCALPDEVKLRFPYDPDTKQSGNGYECKREKGQLLDQKENFHLRLSARDELMNHARSMSEPEFADFIEKALALPDLIMPLLLEFGAAVEERYEVPGFADAVASTKPELLIRFLHYFGECEPGEEIASPHVDKGGFTLHLYESDGGVEQLSQDKQSWLPLPVSNDETVIFPSLGLQQFLGSRVKALCHRVIATPECAQAGRYSAVCFVDFAESLHYDKARHGRLQNFPPGFNYDMPADQFDDLFVK